jgi:hypothetical protein
MPWLSLLFPLGGLSPLTRLITGQEAALQQYLGSWGTRLREAGESPAADPWGEDLFHPPLPTRPPARERGPDNPAGVGGPGASLPGPLRGRPFREQVLDSFWEQCADDPTLLLPPGLSHGGAWLKLLGAGLAGLLLPAVRRREDHPDTPFRGTRR